MRRRLGILTVMTVLLLLAPLVLAFWLSRIDRHYDEILGLYECDFARRCVADFNKDGALGHVAVTEGPQGESQKQSLAVVDGGHEILRLPYVYLDNTVRTHVGIRNSPDRVSLVVYQPGGREFAATEAVFAWSGEKMLQVPPSSADQELLTAMAAREESGTFNQWALFRLLKTPMMVLYYLLLLSLIAFRYRRLIFRQQS